LSSDDTTGKRIGGSLYLHVSALEDQDAAVRGRVAEAESLAGVSADSHYNLVRLDERAERVALLNYPGFFNEPFPALRERWLVDLAEGEVSYRTYADSVNPPILHRKELMLRSNDERREAFIALTRDAKEIGLFEDVRRIGYRRQWEQLIRERGYRVDGHRLVPIGNTADEEEPDAELDEAASVCTSWNAARHRTALVRYGFSAPIQTLARNGLLDGSQSLFDYGCGRGDDVRGLKENGIEAAGWDPYYARENPISAAEIVNLGFVINVIEDFDERLEALTRAWALAERLLVVSVMLANQNDPRGELFRDGVLTRRGTFQKYYTQTEIKAFLEAVLDEEPIPVAPGVLYVFRDKDAEQRFLVDRYRSRRNLLRHPSFVDRPRRERPASGPRPDRAEERYLAHKDLLDRLWLRWVELARMPDKGEVDDLISLTAAFGSLGRALRLLEARKDITEVERARTSRIADLEVYFALNQFERRKPYKHLERGLQRDIKEFFGDYAGAQATARELLFRIADVEAIARACTEAAEHGLGWREAGESLQLHTSMVEQLPPLLRVYVGCAAVLYGDYRIADLVKLHIGSGKVSLMRYDDFEGKPLPRMVERVKIKLREQDIDYFAYGEEYEPPFLYRKSRYINEEFPNYPEQVALDEALDALDLFDFSGYGPSPGEFLDTLAKNRWAVEGFELVRSSAMPDLDDPCGRYLTFRQLIECGETQGRTGLPNLPKRVESYNALHDLAVRVLDPVIEFFGMIRLTYGFCSPALAKEIPGRIDPKRDQHAAYELNRLGRRICERLGAAVDFIVEDESMLEVAQWIVSNTPFDRLYFYGDDLPLHVSYGPDCSRQLIRMVTGRSGRLLPRVTPLEEFLALP
jgi:DNA phosphorothioation-associated putative methyltransferase